MQKFHLCKLRGVLIRSGDLIHQESRISRITLKIASSIILLMTMIILHQRMKPRWSLVKLEGLPLLQIYGICVLVKSCLKNSICTTNVDDGELEYFCGTIARNSELTPLKYADWRKVPAPIKEEIWRVIKSKFNLSPIRRSWILKQVGKCLREFKHTLYSENFLKYKSFAELKAHADPRTKQDEWEKLVDIWYTKEWQQKSVQNKTSRNIMKLLHTSGTISFARRSEMELKSTGKRPGRVKLFVKYHQHKNGDAVTPEAAAIIEKNSK
ncbi:hypothetical protein LINGRAHAP2_LOCUS30786 [Linum grandiflorum]